MIGWGSAVSIVLSWVDKLIPSKKAALVDELNRLVVIYGQALEQGRDTDAAIIRKQISELRKKVNFTDAEI
jgi:hypothetical protein